MWYDADYIVTLNFVQYQVMCRMVGPKIVGDVTLYSHLSDITCCHKAILSPTESSLDLFCSLIILLSKYALQIKMRICLISENHWNVNEDKNGG